MKNPPFKMLPSRNAVLRCDGKFVISGRASFAWETYLMRRAVGVPGVHEIRSSSGVWHRLDHTISEAEEMLGGWGMFPERRIARARKLRASRIRRGLPVG
jgi:hypothetical protein